MAYAKALLTVPFELVPLLEIHNDDDDAANTKTNVSNGDVCAPKVHAATVKRHGVCERCGT